MKKTLLAIAAIALLASSAYSAVLWDQSATRADGAGHWDSDSPGMWGGGIIYGALDFTLTQDAIVQIVTTYYTNSGAWAPGTYDAKFAIYPKTGPTPVTGVDDPLSAPDIPVTIADIGGGVLAVTATDLNRMLAAGDYWLVLSPAAPQGVVGVPEFHIFHDGPVLGDPSCLIEFGGMFGPDWAPTVDGLDGAVLIEGDLPVATDESTWGQFKAIYR